ADHRHRLGISRAIWSEGLYGGALEVISGPVFRGLTATHPDDRIDTMTTSPSRSRPRRSIAVDLPTAANTSSDDGGAAAVVDAGLFVPGQCRRTPPRYGGAADHVRRAEAHAVTGRVELPCPERH